ncbi:MAG: hypothetical protein HZB80_08550 [Deltaproteobacteria bacterium]|nr:hypothetical protein [Deltaproteobacteria bacterium]
MSKIFLPVLSLLLILHLYIPSFSFGVNTAARDAGINAANNTLNVYNNPDKLKSKMFTPLTSKNSPMSTIDNTISFTTQVSCPSSDKFVDVSITVGTLGDIKVDVSQDTNMDGAVDFTNSFNGLSGVCSNGVIACNPGTWNNCQYWRWGVDTSGYIGLYSTTSYNLGGCYCINNSCGNVSSSQISRVTRDTGGGIVGSIQSSNPNFSITNVRSSGNSIIYYGQDTQKCQGQLQQGTQNLSQYSNNPAGLSSAAQSAVVSQLAQSTSAYSAVYNSSNVTGVTNKLVSCSIDIQVSAASTITPLIGTGSGTVPGGQFLFIRVGYVTGSSLYTFNYSPDIVNNNWNTIASVDTSSAAGTLNNFSFCITPSAPGCSLYNATSCTSTTNYSAAIGSCASPPANISYTYSYGFNFINEYVQTDTNNTCTTYENNTDCSLNSETVDGDIKTYISGQPTSATLIPTCKNVTGLTVNQSVCKDWWSKQRTYYCITNPSYDINALIQPSAEIVQTTTLSPDQTTVTYSQNGVSNTVNFSDGGSGTVVGGCSKACKVSKPTTNTQSNASGSNTSTYLNSFSSVDVYYISCANSSTCPNQADETVVIDCSCINTFGETAAAMYGLIAGTKDLICTQ